MAFGIGFTSRGSSSRDCKTVLYNEYHIVQRNVVDYRVYV